MENKPVVKKRGQTIKWIVIVIIVAVLIIVVKNWDGFVNGFQSV